MKKEMAKKQSVKKIAQTSKPIPLGVAILAVLSWITAVGTLILAIGLLTGSAVVPTIIQNVAPDMVQWATAGTALFIFLGIISLLFAAIDYYIGKGLWAGKNWARIVVLILFSLVILGSLSPFDLVSILVAGVVIWYIGFYKNAVDHFK
jgi:hypothetical protein